MQNLDSFLKNLDTKYPVAVDTETTGLHHYQGHRIFGFSIVQLYPKLQKIFFRTDNTDKNKWLLPLKLFLVDPKVKKIFHHHKFDYHMLHCEGIQTIVNYEDTMIKAFFTNENLGPQNYALKKLCARYFKDDPYILEITKLEMQVADDLKRRKTKNYANCNKALMNKYAVGDGILTLKLLEFLDHAWNPAMEESYQIDIELSRVLMHMEHRGINIDMPHLLKLENKFLPQRDKILKSLLKLDVLPLAKKADPQDIGKFIRSQKFKILIYEGMGLRDFSGKIRYTDKEQYQLDNDAIKSIASSAKASGNKRNIKFMQLLLDYRILSTLLSTYVTKYIKYGQQYDNKIYPEYNICVARTGRLSAKEPNTENLPKREEKYGNEIRHIIYNPKWRKSKSNPYPREFFSPDYSQIEYRLFAHYIKSERMTKDFLAGKDYHQHTMDAFNIKRVPAKGVNFATIYGVGISGLAEMLSISEIEAKQILTGFWQKTPEANIFKLKVKRAVKQHGYLRTHYGRRRRINSDKAYLGINAIMQGTAAEVIKKAMIRIDDNLPREIVQMHVPLHDELLMSKPVDEYNKEIIELMEDRTTFDVPLLVEPETFRRNWGVHK